MSLRLMLVFALVPAFAHAADELSAEQAKDILQMAVDAQLTREAQWELGGMQIAIRQTGKNAMSADLSMCWEGDRLYVDLQRMTQESISVNGKFHQEDLLPYRTCVLSQKSWAYFPTLAVVHGWGPGRVRGISSSINVAPLRIWGTVPFIPQIRLSDSMRRSIAQGTVAGTRDESGGVRITSWSRVYVIDPAHDAEIVRIENDLIERSEEAKRVANALRYVATYDWARDPHGVPYCRTFRTEYFGEDGDEPVTIREISVTDYTSLPSAESKRFDLDALNVPIGTQVKYLDSKSRRTWRYGVRGSEAEGLQQPDFDKLIERMKERGFAAPDEEE